MILRMIVCERRGCGKTYQERKENEGFPFWCQIVGLVNENKVPVDLHICPECKDELIGWLKNGLD